MLCSGFSKSLRHDMPLELLARTAVRRAGARFFSTTRPQTADYTHAVRMPTSCLPQRCHAHIGHLGNRRRCSRAGDCPQVGCQRWDDNRADRETWLCWARDQQQELRGKACGPRPASFELTHDACYPGHPCRPLLWPGLPQNRPLS